MKKPPGNADIDIWKPPDFYYYVCKVIVFPTFLGSSPTSHNCHFPFETGMCAFLIFEKSRPDYNSEFLKTQHFPLHPSSNKVSWIYTLWILAPLLLLCIIFNRSLHQKIYHKRTTGTFLSKRRGTLIIFQKRSSWKKVLKSSKHNKLCSWRFLKLDFWSSASFCH